jgi:acetyltransferase-like isoleucine patch superfamily enzyme|tara:strand:+ start:472 stop:948 length:477 start_codon:yes stop_codon:yes gene_type:complete
MQNSKIESKKNIGFYRILDKLLHTIAKSSLLSSKARVFIHHLRGVKFKNRSTVFIGEGVIIDPINPSNVEIGDRCLITAGVKILTHYIDTKNRSENPEYFFRFYDGKVIIEDDVFVGVNAVIAKPVKIGKGSIIGANVVVTKNIKTSSVYTGNNNSQL